MTQVVASTLVNKVSVTGVNESLRSLEKFSNKLDSLKKQFSSIQKNLNINASVTKQSFDKTAKSVERAQKRIVDSEIREQRRLQASKKQQRAAFRGRFMEMQRAGEGLPSETLQKSTAQMREWVRSVRSGKMELSDFNQNMRQMNHQLRQQANNQTPFAKQMKNLRHIAIAATATMTPYAGITSTLDTYKRLESIKASMLSFSTNVGDDFGYLTEQSKRLGLDLALAADGFTKLSVSTQDFMTADQTRELFTGFSELATARGIDPQRFELAANALQQMASKGKISSEELKSQFAEHLPGGIQIFAEAIGKTVPEMLKMMDNGELLSKDVLPKVGKAMANAARKGGALDAQLKSLRVEEGRFKTEWLLLKEAMGKAGFADIAITALRSLTNLIKNETPTLKVFAATLNLAFQTAIAPLTLFIGLIKDVNNMLPNTTTNLGRMAVNIMMITTAIFGMVKGLGLLKSAANLKLGAPSASGVAKTAGRLKDIAQTGAKGVGFGVVAAAVAQPALNYLDKSLGENKWKDLTLAQTAERLKQEKMIVDISLKSDLLEAKVHQIFGDSLNQNSQE